MSETSSRIVITTERDWKERVDAAVADERERCAKIADRMENVFAAFPDASYAAERIAQDIREGK